ncbi:MAG TPA: sulfur transferase domain-containing protein [Gammaproteobacteria bacterium]|nr:sulfur transferase domain-containing protein [Gammaproteobacteria bacterium]
MNPVSLKTAAVCLIFMVGSLTVYAQTPATENEHRMESNLIDTIPNLKHPADDLLTGGQPSPDAIRALKAQGMDVVINLRGVGENDAFNEETLTDTLNVSYYTIPIASAADLNRQNATALDQILKHHKDQQILVHCASGNRVGALFALRAAWLQSKSIDEALEIGHEHGLTGLEPQVAAILAEQ